MLNPTPVNRSTGRMMSRALVALLVVGALTPTVMAATSTADSVYPSFDSAGVVTSTSPAQASFTMNVSSSCATAYTSGNNGSTPTCYISPSTLSSYESSGAITVDVDGTTTYYLNAGSGYVKSDYAHAVIAGSNVEAAGHYIQNSNGVTEFVAVYVWSPPQPPATTSGSPPPTDQNACLKSTAVQMPKPFLISATVGFSRVDLPCTTNGAYPLGFVLYNPTYLSSQMDQAYAAYGGTYGTGIQVYTTALTKYAFGNNSSDFETVVTRNVGNPVTVWGEYFHSAGAWLLVAKLVWAQPPPPVTSTAPITETANVVGGQNPPGTNSYEAVMNGSGFNGDTYYGTWNCTSDPDVTNDPGGTAVTGTWKISNGNNTVQGSFQGTIDASGAITYDLTITNGYGGYTNAQGGGSLTGSASPSAVPGTCPSGFNGTVSLTYTYVTG